MTLLLDTHTLLWAAANDERLSTTARTALLDADRSLVISVVSVWECAIKIRLGKLTLQLPLSDLISGALDQPGLRD